MSNNILCTSTKRHYAWRILFACCCIQIGGLGVLGNCLGLYVSPVCTDMNISTTSFSLYLTLQGASMAITAPFCGKLIQKLSVRKLLMLTSLLASCCYISFGFAHSIIHFYIVGILLGPIMNIVEALSVPMLITAWFEKKQGFALGLAMACAGISGALFNSLLSSVIANISWRISYICMGVISFIFIVPVTFLLVKDTPAMLHVYPYGYLKHTQTEMPKEKNAITTLHIYRKPVFWLVFLAAGLTTYACAFTNFLSAYGVSAGLSLVSSGFMLSAAMIGNTIGAFSLGYLSDRFGYLKTEYFGSITIILSLLAMIFAQNSNLILYMASFFFGLTAAMYSTMNPILVRTVFGTKDYNRIFSYVSAGMMAMNALASVLIGWTYDMSGDYILAISSVIASYIIILISVTLAIKSNKLKEL